MDEKRCDLCGGMGYTMNTKGTYDLCVVCLGNGVVDNGRHERGLER